MFHTLIRLITAQKVVYILLSELSDRAISNTSYCVQKKIIYTKLIIRKI